MGHCSFKFLSVLSPSHSGTPIICVFLFLMVPHRSLRLYSFFFEFLFFFFLVLRMDRLNLLSVNFTNSFFASCRLWVSPSGDFFFFLHFSYCTFRLQDFSLFYNFLPFIAILSVSRRRSHTSVLQTRLLRFFGLIRNSRLKSLSSKSNTWASSGAVLIDGFLSSVSHTIPFACLIIFLLKNKKSV